MAVQPVKRKRVTRVGSGAWSIYLPKKWIDSWTPEQQAGREVDLHLISGRLLIVPALRDEALSSNVAPDEATVRQVLLSAYVQGHQTVRLRPAQGKFDNDAITGARDLLRQLDERLAATVGPEAIGFELRSAAPSSLATRADLLRLMGAKALEVLDLAAECVEQADANPERSLHAARLLQSIQREDLSRLYHQTLRRVATLDVPIETITELQLLDLVTFLLNNIGNHCIHVASTVLADLGLEMTDLAFPRAELVKRLPKRAAAPAVARDILQGHRASFREARSLLERTLRALAASDADALAKLAEEGRQTRFAHQERLFEAVVRHWGDEASKGAARRGFAAYQVANPVTNILSAVVALAQQGLTFTAAKQPRPAA